MNSWQLSHFPFKKWKPFIWELLWDKKERIHTLKITGCTNQGDMSRKKVALSISFEKRTILEIVVLELERATWKLEEFFYSYFKLDEIRVGCFVFLRNSNAIKLEMLEIFKPKLGILVFKLKLKLGKCIFLELNMCSKMKFSSFMKLKFNEMWARSSTRIRHCAQHRTGWLI